MFNRIKKWFNNLFYGPLPIDKKECDKCRKWTRKIGRFCSVCGNPFYPKLDRHSFRNGLLAERVATRITDIFNEEGKPVGNGPALTNGFRSHYFGMRFMDDCLPDWR